MIAPIACRQRLAGFAAICAAALAAASLAGPAEARSARDRDRQDDTVLSRPAGPPVMAIVSIGEQRVTIYDANGRILRAPVSSGQTGYETPSGIFSVIQKNREHYSNLYDDASMPFMQRITWSGIALHAGVLPGRPASHGCIRLPHGFAERLFDLTRMGMRVIVVPTDVMPVEFSHPALFKPRPLAVEASAEARPQPVEGQPPMRLGGEADSAKVPSTVPPKRLQTLRSLAAARAAEAAAAAKKADEARLAAVKLNGESARAMKEQRMATIAKERADAALKSAEDALAGATGSGNEKAIERAREAKTKAEAKAAEAQAQFDSAKAAAEAKAEAVARARDEAKTAEAEKVAAAKAAKEAEAKMAPVSVFISRQAQRLYVRQGFQPIFDSPVTIADQATPMGTYVFTALDYVGDGSDVRWSVVSMTSGGHSADARSSRRMQPDAYTGSRRSHRSDRSSEPLPADAHAAKAALDRITIPQEAIDRISEVVSPGSSLIVSDEPMSKETGKGTDFIVVMSGEPQGGLKIRRRPQPYGGDYDRPYRRSPYYEGSPFSWW
ncbi:MAG TPA: L,D-transpeptidase family protein [Hyphomicrobiaceae bacterium]|nr:L,D-transpeptidase family protein [Hyphomicrobiaceae bacterium]